MMSALAGCITMPGAQVPLATDPAGVSVTEIACNLGILMADAEGVYDTLKRKAPVDERQGRIQVKEHLLNLPRSQGER
jgi:hypothetical protein